MAFLMILSNTMLVSLSKLGCIPSTHGTLFLFNSFNFFSTILCDTSKSNKRSLVSPVNICYHNVQCNAKLHEMENKIATSDGCSRQLRETVPSFTFAMHWHELRSRSIGKCCVRTFIFVFMSTMQGKIVGKMCRNVLYHSGIHCTCSYFTVCSPICAICAIFYFFYSFAVKAAPRPPPPPLSVI